MDDKCGTIIQFKRYTAYSVFLIKMIVFFMVLNGKKKKNKAADHIDKLIKAILRGGWLFYKDNEETPLMDFHKSPFPESFSYQWIASSFLK